MTTIYELYDALLTIKDYCASKDNTCKDCPLTDNANCCIFIKDIAPSNWKLVEPTRRLYK
jgi:hypothetical protein|nr:MAG TPA_asm: hypothetical protein [Caudoviricetes sp.]